MSEQYIEIEQESGAMVLILPGDVASDEWRRANQGTWLVVPETAVPGATITLRATNLPEGAAAFDFTVGGAILAGVVANNEASVHVTIDAEAEPGDEMDVSAEHPTYGLAESVVVISG